MKRDTERLVERAGLILEQDGFPRIAGRIFGLTLVSSSPLSLDEIAETLGVSKASVSNGARLLERMGFLERVSRPGDRRDYYEASGNSFERAINERLRRIDELQSLLEDARNVAPDDSAVHARLDSHRTTFRHVTKALQDALAELSDRQRSRKPNTR